MKHPAIVAGKARIIFGVMFQFAILILIQTYSVGAIHALKVCAVIQLIHNLTRFGYKRSLHSSYSFLKILKVPHSSFEAELAIYQNIWFPYNQSRSCYLSYHQNENNFNFLKILTIFPVSDVWSQTGNYPEYFQSRSC